MNKTIKISKAEIYKKLLITLVIAQIGALLNFIVIKANNVWMPVNYSKGEVKLWFLSDIFRLPLTNNFFSIGDIILVLAVGYFIFNFFKILRRFKK